MDKKAKIAVSFDINEPAVQAAILTVAVQITLAAGDTNPSKSNSSLGLALESLDLAQKMRDALLERGRNEEGEINVQG